jgi:hypothetical protein
MTDDHPAVDLQSFRIPNQVLFREVQGEGVVLHLETNAYFRLDSVGTRVWLAMQEVRTLDAVVLRLLAEFDAPEKTVREDVRQLLRDLASHGLVEPAK